MSWRASGEAKKITKGAHGEKLRHADKLALLIISDDINERMGYGWASEKVLAEECLCSERTFIRLTQRLERFGLLEVEHRGRLGNRYRLPFMVPDCHLSETVLVTNDPEIGDKTEQLGDKGVSPQLDVEQETTEQDGGEVPLMFPKPTSQKKARGYSRPQTVRTYEQTPRESATERRAREANEQTARLVAALQVRRGR